MENFVNTGRPYGGVAPEERIAERRERLLTAAIDCFGTSGYRATTVNDICASAAVAKRSFYESFTDLEDILLVGYGVAVERLRDGLTEGASAHVAPRDAVVRSALTGFYDRVHSHPGLARIAFFEVLGVSPKVDDVYRSATLSFVGTVLEVVEPHVDLKAIESEFAAIFAAGLIGIVLTIAQQWLLDDFTQPIERVVDGASLMVNAALDRLTVDAISPTE